MRAFWGTPKNASEARTWLTKSAKEGYCRSQSRLAQIYYYGIDVAVDYAEAGRWASLAGDQGDSVGELIVGQMFIFGEGVAADAVAGAAWLLKAADQGHPRAQGLLGVMHAQGIGVKRDWIQALKWLKSAADGGDERAIDFLRTNGVEYDSTKRNGSRHHLTADSPIANNPAFDVTLIYGRWTTKLGDPRMDIAIEFEETGTFRAEVSNSNVIHWHYGGRWAVEGNKLLWDIQTSDMPLPFDDDTDDTVISISREEIVSSDSNGTMTVYRRVARLEDGQKSTVDEKVVFLSAHQSRAR